MGYYTHRAIGKEDVWGCRPSLFGGYTGWLAGYQVDVPHDDRQILFVATSAVALYDAGVALLAALDNDDITEIAAAHLQMAAALRRVETGKAAP